MNSNFTLFCTLADGRNIFDHNDGQKFTFLCEKSTENVKEFFLNDLEELFEKELASTKGAVGRELIRTKYEINKDIIIHADYILV